MRTKLFILIAFIFLFSNYMNAQTNANLEAGFSVGFASFQTDFGQRSDSPSTHKNRGLALGGVVYLNFFNRDPILSGPVGWGQQHFKLKGEISYLQADLEHYGDYAEEETPDGVKLRNMTGKSSILNVGTVLEYHPFPIPDFIPGPDRKISPYFGLGVMAGFSSPTIEVATGDWQTNPSLLIDAYQPPDGEVDDSSSIALSLMFSGGLRFKLDDKSALQLDMRWQYFNSDLIDGLNPNPELVPNKHDDWLYYLNLGYIYKFGPDSKISTWFKRSRR